MTLEIQKHVPLAPLTTFQIGGTARYFVDVRGEGEVLQAVEWARENGVPVLLLAGGSNVLLKDGLIDALVVRMTCDSYVLREDGLDAEAGCNLLGLIRVTAQSGFGGWEKLAGIPGTLGGAVRGNAGAFGPEIKDFVLQVRCVNIKTGDRKKFANDECDFSYRHSFFKDNRDWVIISVRLGLLPSTPESSAKLIEDTILERERRHLQNVRAAGSFFMNPVAPQNIVDMFEKEKNVKSKGGRVPAGWLIEKAGMKGATVGGAIASLQHPNYVVNQTGTATASDVLELASRIKTAVKEQFGIDLKEEAEVVV
jgi:UDP-N-acetylmuramate dehydrogenase